jgi:adenylate cyclase
MDVLLGTSKTPRESLDRAEELAKRAIALADSEWYPHAMLSLVYRFKKQFDKSIASAQQAVALSPNSAQAHFWLGAALYDDERYEEAIPCLKKSLRLSPILPMPQCMHLLAGAYRSLGRYDEAVAIFKKLIRREPDHLPAHLGLAATYVMVGRMEEARAEAAEVLRIDPQFSVERFAKAMPYKQKMIDQLVESWRKAGLR